MSEAMILRPVGDTTPNRVPTVYFIDDSATMREVIKIAFRRENMNVITCADAASALAQFNENRPDIVITDVIMPDQDGYSVCSQIKQNPDLTAVPVVLMSGVVNKTVADKAVSVKADELIRKPFQPQELIARVKSLLRPKVDASESSTDRPPVSSNAGYSTASFPNALSNLFALPPASSLAPSPASPFASSPAPTFPASAVPPSPMETKPSESAWPRALAEAFTNRPTTASGSPQSAQPPSAVSAPAETVKLRSEIARMELLIKKLQTELQLERQYIQALELQIQTLVKAG